MKNALIAMRRQDRAQTEDWIGSFLRQAKYGVLATCEDGQPFTVARNFVYDMRRNAVYFHGARKGRTFEQAQRGVKANLNISEMGAWILAERAMDFGVKYKSAVLFGKLALVEDPVEAKEALEQLMGKYFPDLRAGKDYRAVTEADLKRTAVIRFEISAWSGKEKKS